MKAVVFGGSGFLGSHVADALTDRGYEVTIFDLRLSPYLRPNQEMVVGDIVEGATVAQVLNGCNYVYHFAGLADLDDATTKPLDTVEQNVRGTFLLVDAAVKAGVKRFVYASTVYVYSDLGGFYRCSKQAAELYLEEYQRRYGIDFTIVRYGSLYGPRADMRNSIYRYLRQALLEGKVQFGGSKDDIREYVHVRDAAKLSVDILSEKFRNQHIIITGHHPTKVTDLLNMIRDILNRDLAIEFCENQYSTHYTVTPYSFAPKMGNKAVNNHYVDMGQGLLECLYEIYSSEGGAEAFSSHSNNKDVGTQK